MSITKFSIDSNKTKRLFFPDAPRPDFNLTFEETLTISPFDPVANSIITFTIKQETSNAPPVIIDINEKGIGALRN